MRNTIKRTATAILAAVAFAGAFAPVAHAQTAGTTNPDSRRPVFFAMFRYNTTDIYSVYEDGTSLKRHSSWSAYEGQPSVNRDRNRVAYVADYYGRRSINLMTPGSGTYEVLAPINGTTDKAPSLSPNGNVIAFASNRTGAWHIYTVNIDGSNLRRLTFEGQNTEPAWSPDGTKIAFTTTRFTGVNEVATMTSTGGSVNRVSFGGGQEPAWSPWPSSVKPLELAYAVKPTGYTRFRIERQLVDYGNVPVVVAQLSVDATDPTWSPDGTRILFSTSGGNGPLYSANANGSGGLKMVMSNSGGWIGSANWGYPASPTVAQG